MKIVFIHFILVLVVITHNVLQIEAGGQHVVLFRRLLLFAVSKRKFLVQNYHSL